MLVRIFDADGTPNDSTINEVDMDVRPMTGDRVEFFDGSEVVSYLVKQVIFRFGGLAQPGECQIAAAVTEISDGTLK